MNYTHALTLKIEGIPDGFFPIGDEATLTDLYQRNSGTVNNMGKPVDLMRLNFRPSFTDNGVTQEMIADGLSALIKGDKELNISTGGVIDEMKGAVAAGKETAQEFKSMASQAIRNRQMPQAMEALPLLMTGSKIADHGMNIFKSVASQSQKLFVHRQTEDFICNEHGYFVSEKWLNNNATRIMKVETKKPKQLTKNV